MAISVDYTTTPWLITIPKADLTLDIGTKYNLEVDTFWQLLRDYADSPEGVVSPVIYTRVAATTSTPSITEVNDDYYELQFEDGLYSVNIIYGNTNIREVEVKNQVSVNTNNTTGFIDADPAAIWSEESSTSKSYGVLIEEVYGHVEQRIYVDTELLEVGTGYQQTPHNNWSDAVDHAESDHISKLAVISDATVDRQLKNFDIEGVGVPAIDLNGQIMDGTRFYECKLTGSYTGFLIAKQSQLYNISGLNGAFKEVAAVGTLTIGAHAKIWGIASGSTADPYIIDMNGTTVAEATLTDAQDGLVIQNMKNAADILHIHGGHGIITINNTCTLGDIHISGDWTVVNNSAGATVVVNNVQISADNVWSHLKALTLGRYLGLK